MAVIGFFSAIPMYFLVSTMIFFAKERGLCASQIGLLSLMTFPYSLKILVSVVISRWHWLPWLKKVGVKRFWALFAQIVIAFLFYKGPGDSMRHALVWVLFISLMSAVLDCALEAYRIESTAFMDQGAASVANAFGWRVGAWVVSYVPLVISYYWNWKIVFHFLCSLSFLGVFSFIFLKPLKSDLEQAKKRIKMIDTLLKGLSFFQKQTHFGFVVAMILSYKMGDIFLRHMMGCYLVDVGCSTNMIAQMDKGVGVISTLMGVSLCGAWIHKKGLQKAFHLWWWNKILTAFLFFIHSVFCFVFFSPLSMATLWFFDALSHFAGGIGSTALLSYFAFLCKKSQKNAMICYGILSSISAIGRTFFSTFAGYMASFLQSWPLFFGIAMLLLLPAFWVFRSTLPFVTRHKI